jgi:hypothetical protein
MQNILTSTAFTIGNNPIEMFKHKDAASQHEIIQKAVGVPHAEAMGSNIDANLWLPFAAKKYMLSTDIRDYVLVPVPILFTDLPNTNGDSVSAPELLDFDPELGMQAFKTFKGKPTFYEHANKDITKAKGVILDVFLRPLRNFGGGRYYKLIELLAFDRTKDPLLVNSILSGENNAYSLGFYFKSYKCSICGKLFGEGGLANPCEHTQPRRPTYRRDDGRLAYRQCRTIRGFETSVVESPAYIPAISPHVMNLRDH